MSDPRFLQTGRDKILSHLIEECGEVLSAAGKTQRWGWDSVNPLIENAEEAETNEEWLFRELSDLEEAINRLRKASATGDQRKADVGIHMSDKSHDHASCRSYP